MRTNNDEAEYVVLVNDEEQYSLWPAGLDIPDGWRIDGPRGSKGSCLSYIKDGWTDMRPKSLREALARQGR